MYKFHLNKNGNSQMICTMEDEHLINTIRFYAKKINACTDVLATEDSVNFQIMSAFNPSYSVKRQKDDALKRIVLLTDKLAPYVMEAVLRNLGGKVSEYLQMAYSRNSGVNYNLRQLPSIDIDDDDEVFTDIDESVQKYAQLVKKNLIELQTDEQWDEMKHDY